MSKKITPEVATQLYAYIIATKYEIDKKFDDLLNFLDNSGFNVLALEEMNKMKKENENDNEQDR